MCYTLDFAFKSIGNQKIQIDFYVAAFSHYAFSWIFNKNISITKHDDRVSSTNVTTTSRIKSIPPPTAQKSAAIAVTTRRLIQG